VLDPVRLIGDRSLLRQVLDNLLDNAIKYTAANGHVRIALRRAGATAALTVADEGVGISGDALPHVFDPFFREDSSRTRATGGTGLGLAIVARVVEAHGGQVAASSEAGRGAQFRVELPL
jgi:two-component system sensor histidine kinase BaeS